MAGPRNFCLLLKASALVLVTVPAAGRADVADGRDTQHSVVWSFHNILSVSPHLAFALF